MKKIPLTQGKFALVDDADFEWLNQWKWCYGNNEAHRNGGGKWIKMHRLIMGSPVDKVVDHINGNRFDNRRENLRVCTQQQNTLNCKVSKNSKSGYKDIFWVTARHKWLVQIMSKGRKFHGGYYIDLQEAVDARDVLIKKLHGDYARTEASYV